MKYKKQEGIYGGERSLKLHYEPKVSRNMRNRRGTYKSRSKNRTVWAQTTS
jgi:hypothetical protein